MQSRADNKPQANPSQLWPHCCYTELRRKYAVWHFLQPPEPSPNSPWQKQKKHVRIPKINMLWDNGHKSARSTRSSNCCAQYDRTNAKKGLPARRIFLFDMEFESDQIAANHTLTLRLVLENTFLTFPQKLLFCISDILNLSMTAALATIETLHSTLNIGTKKVSKQLFSVRNDE